MILVNPYFLDVFLKPITGLGDDEEAVLYYQKVELVTEVQYKAVIRNTLVKEFNNLDENKKQKAKLALSYYLTRPEIDFRRVFDSCLPPFDLPENAQDFFVWLWEVLFKDESYIISKLESYKVVPDIYEPNRPLLQ